MDAQNVFPLDITERRPGVRPWKFRHEGFLVLVMAGEDEAARAEGSLVAAGFAPRDIKVYPGEQILATYEIYKGQVSLADRTIGVVTDDIAGRDLYLDYARQGRVGLWVRVPEDKVAKALRVLAGHHYLHTRYYGEKTETDYHLSGPSD
jgi:hypothetical protein